MEVREGSGAPFMGISGVQTWAASTHDVVRLVEREWVRVARESVGAEGQVVLQQWLAHSILDLLIYGATPLGGALRCDATLVSPLTRTG